MPVSNYPFKSCLATCSVRGRLRFRTAFNCLIISLLPKLPRFIAQYQMTMLFFKTKIESCFWFAVSHFVTFYKDKAFFSICKIFFKNFLLSFFVALSLLYDKDTKKFWEKKIIFYKSDCIFLNVVKLEVCCFVKFAVCSLIQETTDIPNWLPRYQGCRFAQHRSHFKKNKDWICCLFPYKPICKELN